MRVEKTPTLVILSVSLFNYFNQSVRELIRTLEASSDSHDREAAVDFKCNEWPVEGKS